MNGYDEYLQERINKLHNQQHHRTLKIPASHLRDFTSNDYLGLARSEKLFQIIQQKHNDQEKHVNGATGSRLLSGNNALVVCAEKMLAQFFNGQEALIFNSGYTANLGVLSTLPQRGDTILYDEYAHACLKDGARLSLAHRYSFKHNNLSDLERKLNQATGNVFIVMESIYSMDGDACPLTELVDLAQHHQAILIVDEAHSTGIYGSQGNGYCNAYHIQDAVHIRIHTFGKAMGVHGACIVCSPQVKDFLINTSRPFIYATALPPHSIHAMTSAVEFLKQNPNLQNTLQHKINLFKKNYLHDTGSMSSIQPIIIPGNSNTQKAAQLLNDNNFDIRPILSPTVKKGSERIRICLHTFNTDDDILELTQLLNQIVFQ